MEYVDSFRVPKYGRMYAVVVDRMHPDGMEMLFQIDTGSSYSFLGLNSFCDEEDEENYALLRDIVTEAIEAGEFEKYKNTATTATDQEIEMYPCKFEGVSIAETLPKTLYFYFYLGNAGMPLLGFDYIDDCSYHHSIGGELTVNAVATDVGKRFYPDKVIDFNAVLESFLARRKI